MKTSQFKQDIGWIASLMKRLMIGTKECGQLSSKINFFGDSWFSGLKNIRSKVFRE